MKPIRARIAAERDVDDARDYYTDEAGEDVARQFLYALDDVYRAIRERPGMGSPRYAERLKIKGLRTRKVGRFPYFVFYVEQDRHIDVWRIIHAQRDIPAFFQLDED